MKRKRKLINKLILILTLSVPLLLYGKGKEIRITTKLLSDSIQISIINNSKDTIFFSLFEQIKFGNKWSTSHYDIFYILPNPTRRVLKILPKEKLVIINRKNTFPIVDDGNTTDEQFEKVSLGKRRIKLVVVSDPQNHSKNSEERYYISNPY